MYCRNVRVVGASVPLYRLKEHLRNDCCPKRFVTIMQLSYITTMVYFRCEDWGHDFEADKVSCVDALADKGPMESGGCHSTPIVVDEGTEVKISKYYLLIMGLSVYSLRVNPPSTIQTAMREL